MPPSAMMGIRTCGRLRALQYRGDLGHADAGHHPGGEMAAGADANLDAVHAPADQGLCGLCRGHVARYQLDIGYMA